MLWLKANLGIIIRVVAIVLVFAMLFYAVRSLAAWHSAYEELPKVIKQAEDNALKAQARYDSLKSAYDVAANASQRYQDELDVLQASASIAPTAPKLRLCPEARVSRTSAKGATPSGSGESAAASGVLREPLLVDTQPILEGLRHCDRLSAQVRQLIPLAQ